jgi:hypothetical protein
MLPSHSSIYREVAFCYTSFPTSTRSYLRNLKGKFLVVLVFHSPRNRSLLDQNIFVEHCFKIILIYAVSEVTDLVPKSYKKVKITFYMSESVVVWKATDNRERIKANKRQAFNINWVSTLDQSRTLMNTVMIHPVTYRRGFYWITNRLWATWI